MNELSIFGTIDKKRTTSLNLSKASIEIGKKFEKHFSLLTPFLNYIEKYELPRLETLVCT